MESLSTRSSQLPDPNPLPTQKVVQKKDATSNNLSIIINKYDRKHSNSPRLEKKVELNPPESGNLQSITEAANITAPASRFNEIENRMKNIFNVLCKYIHRLKSPSDGMKAFNKNVDKIRTTTPDWREHIFDHVKVLSEREILSLIDMPILHLRGYDREFLHTIYSVIDDNVDRTQLTEDQIKKLEERVNHFQTLVVEVPEKDMELIGGGAVNKVHLIKYKDSQGVEQEGVFKPDLDKCLPFYALRKQISELLLLLAS